MSNLNKTPQELKEIFEWYAEWVVWNSDEPEAIIGWLCDNLKPKALETIVDRYEFNKWLND